MGQRNKKHMSTRFFWCVGYENLYESLYSINPMEIRLSIEFETHPLRPYLQKRKHQKWGRFQQTTNKTCNFKKKFIYKKDRKPKETVVWGTSHGSTGFIVKPINKHFDVSISATVKPTTTIFRVLTQGEYVDGGQ